MAEAEIEETEDVTEESTEEGDAEETAEAPQEPTEVETLAQGMGWAPKEEWRGDPDKWTDAATFIKTGPEILKTSLRRQDEQLKKMGDTLEEFKGHYQNVQATEYKRAIAVVKAERRQAVEDGDVEAVDAFDGQIEELGDAIKASVPEEKREATPDDDPNFKNWHSRPENSWYNSDVFLTSKADNEIAPTIAKMFPDLIGTEGFYNKVTEETKKAYPDKFGNKNRRKAPSVEGAGELGGRSTGKQTYADLPTDAKAACKKFVDQGLMTKEEYTKDFFEMEA